MSIIRLSCDHYRKILHGLLIHATHLARFGSLMDIIRAIRSLRDRLCECHYGILVLPSVRMAQALMIPAVGDITDVESVVDGICEVFESLLVLIHRVVRQPSMI